jgi:hypothetical protein
VAAVASALGRVRATDFQIGTSKDYSVDLNSEPGYGTQTVKEVPEIEVPILANVGTIKGVGFAAMANASFTKSLKDKP